MKPLLSSAIARVLMPGLLALLGLRTLAGRADDETDPLLPFGGVWH
jgi:hypothetical protein